MDSVNRTTEDDLKNQLDEINACYEKCLELLREAQLTGEEVNAAERLRPMMQRVLELEEQAGLKKENVKGVVRSSKSLTALVKDQELLLQRLLQEVQQVEMKLTSKRTQISQVRDRQQRRQEMQTAYQQHK